MAYWHGLYDDDLYDVIKDCDLSYLEFEPDKLKGACDTAYTRFNELIVGINGYDVFGKCF